MNFLEALPESLSEQAAGFASQLAQWVLVRSGEPELARAALALALSQAAGHIGMALGDSGEVPALPGFPPLDPVALRESSWVSDGSSARPFVWQGGRFYSWRSQQAELRVGTDLGARRQAPPAPAADGYDGIVLSGQLLPIDAPDDPALDQRLVLQQAPGRQLYTLTGGPGTGKTATVLRLLLLEIRRRAADASRLRIALAAPTGKAAQRLAQAIVQSKAQLAGALGPEWQTALSQVPEQASTLHRLLGLRPLAALDPVLETPTTLPLDLVVVDEASMIDLDLMDALLRALAPQTQLYLLGDPDQLNAVGAGSVLADLVAANAVQNTSGLGRLRHIWRAGGALVDLASALRGGQIEACQALFAQQPAQLRWSQPDQPAALNTLLRRWLQSHQAHFKALLDPAIEPAAALQKLGQLQILCAVREGAFGVLHINRSISAWLQRRQPGLESSTWFHGRAIIITRNQPTLGLFNGDLGICLHSGTGEPRLWFAASDGSSGVRSFLPRQLPEHEEAYALTVHKSQGSEYHEVLLILPPDPEHRLLSRELLYTGATRAKHRLELWATEAALAAALRKRTERSGGLAERLRSS